MDTLLDVPCESDGLEDSEPAASYACPACSSTGEQSSFACCGEFGEDGCCGNPRPKSYACMYCHGSGQATTNEILRFAQDSADPEIYALHEAHLMIEPILPGHPARKKGRSSSI